MWRPTVAVTSILVVFLGSDLGFGLGFGLGSGAALAAPLETVAERSGFARTGRLDEVVKLCADAEREYPGRARCVRVGVSPEGRPLVALAVSADGVLDPQRARDKRRPVVLVIAGIHAGEIEGKDAGFLTLRGLLDGSAARGALDAVTLLFVPVFNVDGHERVSRHGRPNQRGPEEKGFRGTAQNLNLNRDWMKADAPEMGLMLGLLEAWDPVVVVDLHTTDGAKFQHDVSVIVAPDAARADGLDEAASKLAAAIQRRLAESGHLPLPFIPRSARTTIPPRASSGSRRRRASRRATSASATASASWSRRTRGRPTPSAWPRPATPSSRCSKRRRATRAPGAPPPTPPTPRRWPGCSCPSPTTPSRARAPSTSLVTPTASRGRR